jgi:hypothetical protein
VQNIGLSVAPLIIGGLMPSNNAVGKDAYSTVEYFFMGLGGAFCTARRACASLLASSIGGVLLQVLASCSASGSTLKTDGA